MDDAKSSGEDNEMPSLRLLPVSAEEYYTARASEPETKALAARVVDAVVDALIRPLTPEEEGPEPVVEKEEREKTIKVTGKGHRDASEVVNQLFLDRKWADGLPIVPPTEEAVGWMLTGTSRSPDEVIGGPVAMKGGIATVEKIAINSVMAGAKPEYLPVIIAAMEILADESYFLNHLQASTGAVTPVIFVNGPIAKELDFNSGIGYLGHGWRANNTIGRAIRLCLINLGHVFPQLNDMALTGRPAAFGTFTFAENEDMNPWEPYHVELGFSPQDSTVTVVSTMFWQRGPGGAVFASTANEQLMAIADMITNITLPELIGVLQCGQTFLLGMAPALARELAKRGMSKDDVRRWLYEQARIPYSKLTPRDMKRLKTEVENGKLPPNYWVEGGYRDKEPSIPAVLDPERILIVVAGGDPAFTVLWEYPEGFEEAHGTKKITGATLTAGGRQ